MRSVAARAADRHGLWPRKLIGDTGYGSAGMLAWLVHERGIEPHVPVFDKSARSDGAFERSDFTFDHEDDSYICPAGRRLRPRNRNFTSPRPEADQDGFIRYRARQQDCSNCALKRQCTPILPARKVKGPHDAAGRDQLAPDPADMECVSARRQCLIASRNRQILRSCSRGALYGFG